MTATGVVGAVDIGGTHVAAGRVRLASATVEPDARLRLEFTGDTKLLERILDAARSIATAETRSLGVAVPGPFDYDGGICLVAHKLRGLYGINLRRELAQAAGLTDVSFLNDAEAFLLGEWWAGAARGHARALGVTLGTGLGSAFLEDGRFVRAGYSSTPTSSCRTSRRTTTFLPTPPPASVARSARRLGRTPIRSSPTP